MRARECLSAPACGLTYTRAAWRASLSVSGMRVRLRRSSACVLKLAMRLRGAYLSAHSGARAPVCFACV
eukprot:4572652-Pleurochrysis_carterae.AAC.2